jgi:hypothetical protein
MWLVADANDKATGSVNTEHERIESSHPASLAATNQNQ